MDRILLGKGEQPVTLLARYGNRHGLVAGATGTGKTVSLLVLAEGFSRLGVPVFVADVKGDIAGLALAGSGDEKMRSRAAELGAGDYAPEASAEPGRPESEEGGTLHHMLWGTKRRQGLVEKTYRAPVT